MKYLIIVLIFISITGGCVFGGYQWSEADAAKRVTELQKIIYDLGIVVQNETNKTGEKNRELIIANRGRIDAIKLNDHNNDTIEQLQFDLDKSVNELDNVRRYIVLNVNAVKRVYDKARNECNGLPDAIDTPIISSRISEFTGDSITGVVRYIVADRCEIATNYNSLYSTCETLLQAKKNPGD